MRITFRGPLPPDHPIFHGGVSFVFRSYLPARSEPEEQDDDADERVVDER
jgi:hypothetical protein